MNEADLAQAAGRPATQAPGGVRLRLREPGDGPELCALFNEPSFLNSALLREPFGSAEEVNHWLDHINAEKRYELVAAYADRCVGFVALYAQGGYIDHCGMVMLGVREACRGKGVGSLLIGSIIAVAQRFAALRKVQLTVFVDNPRAIRLYQRHGFQIEGLHRRFARRGDGFVDAYAMALLLDPPDCGVSPGAAPV